MGSLPIIEDTPHHPIEERPSLCLSHVAILLEVADSQVSLGVFGVCLRDPPRFPNGEHGLRFF